MRSLALFLIALSVCATLSAPPAAAQVTLNLDAIDQQPAKPQQPAQRPAQRPAARPAAKPAQPPATQQQAAPQAGQPPAQATPGTRPGAQPTARGATPTPPAQAPQPAPAAPATAAATAAAVTAITIPDAPAAPPVIPPTPTPPAAMPPARPTPVAAAGSTAAAMREGLRVTFSTGASDLSPDAAAALERFGKAAPKEDSVTFNVSAFASGNPEDPSTPRRLALARALAIRTALMAEGVASSRIYVRAYGTAGDAAAGPQDRVDIAVLGLGAAPAMKP